MSNIRQSSRTSKNKAGDAGDNAEMKTSERRHFLLQGGWMISAVSAPAFGTNFCVRPY